MDGPIYVLDANVFIEAARRYYAFDIAPGFWRNLVHHAENEHIESIDRVKNERSRGKDQLAEWVDGDFSAAFSSTDRSDVIREYAGIMTWANGQYQYFGTARSEFARGADGWLVAYARVVGRVIVTHEEAAPDARRKVPIPNVCAAFGVPFIDTFEMLRALGVRLT